MALKKTYEEQKKETENTFENISKSKTNTVLKGRYTEERMNTVSFQMRPTEYDELKDVFEKLGLTKGAGIRFALKFFMNNYDKRTMM